MIKSLLRLSLFVAVLLPTLASAAEMKIAVLDRLRAVGETETAKTAMTALQTQYKSDIDAVNSLATQMGQAQEKLAKEGEVMAAAARDKLTRELRDKQADYQFRVNKLNTARQDRMQEIIAQLGTKFEKVVSDIITADGYDVVLDRQAVLMVKPAFDITRKVTERLNAGG